MKRAITALVVMLVSVAPLVAQPAATDSWTVSVMTMAPATYVRVSGDQLGRKAGTLHSVDAGQIIVETPQGAVRFDRAHVQTIERLLHGNPRAKARGMRNGFRWGGVIAAIGAINARFSPIEMTGGRWAGFYAVTLGGGAALGYFASLKDKAEYIRVYRR